ILSKVALAALVCTAGPPVPGTAQPADPTKAQKPLPPGTEKPSVAPAAADAGQLPLEAFRPRSMLRVQEHRLQSAKLPVVDVHVHPRVRLRESQKLLDDFVKLMDAQNIAVCVSLDGGMGEQLLEHKKYLWTKHRARWVFFANVDWRGQGTPQDPAS